MFMASDETVAATSSGTNLKREFTIPIQIRCPYCGDNASYNLKVCTGTFPPPRLLFCGASEESETGCGRWFAARAVLDIRASIETFRLGEQDAGNDPNGDCVIAHQQQ
jgi:hypothetical protein